MASQTAGDRQRTAPIEAPTVDADDEELATTTSS
jgi:hypothetical protein